MPLGACTRLFETFCVPSRLGSRANGAGQVSDESLHVKNYAY